MTDHRQAGEVLFVRGGTGFSVSSRWLAFFVELLKAKVESP
jgi:hypothetical protein